MPPLTIALLALAALGAGTVDAIAGGGGLITLPALLAAGLAPLPALATNKGQSVWGSFAALVAFWRADRVDRRQARYAFPLAFAGSLAGVIAVSHVSNAALRPVVLVLLVAAAVVLVVKKPMREADAPRVRPYAVAALALVLGAYDGFFGPGVGTFLIVGFVAVCGRSLVHASADAKVVNFASNLAALIAFALAGQVVWEVSLAMAVGQLVGGALGAQLALKGGARVVRILVLVVSGVLCAKLAWQLAGA
ncbi:MAG TPA: TSUP family transporter [Kofleriaceae bacterium]